MTTSPNETPAPRTPTAIDAVAERYVDALARLSPMTAIALGLPGDPRALDDFSPAGAAALAEAAAQTLGELGALEPTDDVDVVTKAAMTERLALDVELHNLGYTAGNLNVIESPLQEIRSIFDLSPTGSADDWADIAGRLRAVPGAIAGYIESLALGKERGRVAAIRQVRACTDQARKIGADDGFFATFAAEARPDDGELPEALRGDLRAAAAEASGAYLRLADYLEAELAPVARADDAVGREEYAVWSQYFVGSKVDLEESYRWGLEELDRIVAEQEAVAEQIKPGASVDEAIALLDADESLTLHGTEALQAWMQGLSDTAVRELAAGTFDIPEPIRTLECRIAPTDDGGIYYTGPTDDFSRPGRMWWAVPAGVTTFNTWRETTTVYHEGVPGHHLQTAQTVYRRELLNRWRRLACWISGHGEGWALYAERLMADLGYLDSPADRMGMLDGQRMRAARVVLDIGVHLRLPAPERWGGGIWDAEKAWVFLKANANMDERFLAFELDRYLGWPGQAPSYKLGQRLWEGIRDDARSAAEAAGEPFDLKAFHRRALDVGSVGMDTLRRALLDG